MCKAIVMQLRVLGLLLVLSSASVAASGGGGVDVGNGGNGIQSADGSIQLDDLAELSINPDAVIQANIASRATNQNYTMQRSVRRLLRSKFNSDTHNLDDRIVIALETQLSVLAYRYPTFVKKLLDFIDKMQWERTPSLEPNNDAKLKLVLDAGQKEIGCAENKFGRVQISQVCEKGMSPGNFAALIVHEAIYAYLASTDNRIAEKLEDSTPARRIVAEVFRAKAEDLAVSNKNVAAFQAKILSITLPGDKEIIGLKELFSGDAAISNTFFPGNRSFISSYNCDFQANDALLVIKNVSFLVQFKGAYFASGSVHFSDDNPLDVLSCTSQIFGYANRSDGVQGACLSNPQYQLTQSWVFNELPVFDPDNAVAQLSLVKLSSHEKMVLHISANSEVPSKLEVFRGYNPDTDHYAVTAAMDGSCKNVPMPGSYQ